MLKEKQDSSPQITLSTIMKPIQNDLEAYRTHLRLSGGQCQDAAKR